MEDSCSFCSAYGVRPREEEALRHCYFRRYDRKEGSNCEEPPFSLEYEASYTQVRLRWHTSASRRRRGYDGAAMQQRVGVELPAEATVPEVSLIRPNRATHTRGEYGSWLGLGPSQASSLSHVRAEGCGTACVVGP